MPNIKSAKKRVKVIATKTLINKSASAELRTDIKKANLALEKSGAESAETIRVTMKAIDQAAAKGILHKNNAARKKSALARKLNAVKA